MDNLTSKKLLLFDGIGAVVSAFLLGVVLVQFQPKFGMPKNILYVLAALACFFAVYSFSSFLMVKHKWHFYLKIIAIVNLCYCALTLLLSIYFHKSITPLGWTYFIGEIVVICSLVALEFKVAKNESKLSN